MGKLADNSRASLDAAREATKAAWADFEEARTAATNGEGEIPADEVDALEAKHAFYKTTAADEATAEGMWERMVAIEGSGVAKTGTPAVLEHGNGNGSGSGEHKRHPALLPTPGSRFIDSQPYKDLIAGGAVRSKQSRVAMPPVEVWSRDEASALGSRNIRPPIVTTGTDPLGGYLTIAERAPAIVDLPIWPRTILPYIPRSTTDTDAVEWVQVGTFNNAAAPVAQAIDLTTGLKPQSDLALAIVQSPVQTIAHWIAATRQALQDASRLRDLIDTYLRTGIEVILEQQVLNGSGTAPNLRGIMNTVGINDITPTAIPATEAIFAGISAVLADGYQPNLVVMNPADFGSVRLSKEAPSGAYHYGPPSIAGPTTMWGLPILQTPRMAAGLALVGDFSQCTLWVREGVVVTASSEHADFFIRNLVAVLAEGGWAFGVGAPQAFAKVDLVV